MGVICRLVRTGNEGPYEIYGAVFRSADRKPRRIDGA